MPDPAPPPSPAMLAASAIQRAFESYHEAFRAITRRACDRFVARDWHGAQHDSVERLDIYAGFIDQTIRSLRSLAAVPSRPDSVWRQVKAEHGALIAEREDRELAETFFNSITRKLFGKIDADPQLSYVETGPGCDDREHPNPVFRTYVPNGSTRSLVADILRSYRFAEAHRHLERDAARVAVAIEAHFVRTFGSDRLEAIDIAEPLFFRNKGAYIVGRIHARAGSVPLVLPLLNAVRGIFVDTVLLDEDDVSILFSFTRSYFHVEVEAPRRLILFLKSLMPLKPIAELYIAIGHNKHGKSELYRDLLRHLESSTDRFEIARGEKGMVMIVFTLPSYDIVFKVIRDTFAYPKTTVRRQVMEKYSLVFKHDRAGRLVDAQEFENWRFEKSRFSGDLLAELAANAQDTVSIDGGSVVISHLYTERRLTPLNLYIREAPRAAAVEAVIEYGQTLKDLAATNIFPGDLLLKNFGVTRHGRVVFYDYDELCLLSQCSFRTFPRSEDPADELSAEPWYFVDENDVFPEEFIHFLGLNGGLKESFLQAHGDLLGVEFWRDMQHLNEKGEIVDLFPYKPERRFPRDGG